VLLKVGELAKHTGLTVRTLHHYDEIGLLKPSGRSESGYRLYSQEDVARLHGIQALRHLGLPLGDIAALLDGAQAAPAMILEQQVNALDQQIAQATELRGRLALIRDGITQGAEPGMGDWLQALALMATYGKYFSAAELKTIFGRWSKIEHEWPALLKEVRAAMDTGAAADSPEIMVLARRWMSLVHHWMDGDFELMHRWGDMYRREPIAHGRKGGPPTDMFHFMQSAIDLRMTLLQRHFDLSELRRFRYVPEQEWREVNATGRQLLQAGKPADGAEARALLAQWLGLMDRLVGHDPGLREKLMRAQRAEPLLQASSAVCPEVRQFLQQAFAVLDPHAT
jgi:DNA-binding transcriptional MerR regulator